MLILFRTDANPEIGMGHLARCLAIAGELKRRNVDCLFLISDMMSKTILAEQGYRSLVLETSYDSLENEAIRLLDIIKPMKADAIFVDTHFATTGYIETLRAIYYTIYVDDLNDFYAPADILVNYNVYASTMIFSKKYKEKYKDSQTRLLLGTDYTPLRSFFQNRGAHTVKKTVENVLVLTGGSDPTSASFILLNEIIQRGFAENKEIHFVIGKMNKHRNRLEEIASGRKNVCIHTEVDNISVFMENADVAISAAGVTLYELSSLGVPTITYSLADNQIPNAEEFERQELALNAGDCRNTDLYIKRLGECFESLCTSYEERVALSTNMRKMIDGKGTCRIADEIIHEISKKREETAIARQSEVNYRKNLLYRGCE